MAGSVNRVILIGNLGADPEVRNLPSGGVVANFRIATAESWRDKSTGEKKEKTEWHSIAVFNEGLCGVVEQYLGKGSTVYIEGQLQTRKWQDQNGNDRYSTEVVLPAFGGKLVMLGKGQGGDEDRGQRSAGGNSGGGRSGGNSASSSGGRGGRSSGGGSRQSNSDFDTDEIPF